jgi:hypothetical protein
VKTAILFYIYPIFVTGLSLAKQRLILFPWSP